MPRRDGPRTSINNIVVTGYEKRKQPSKHYVFVIDIVWDNDERYEVFRRYSEFFTLQETLKILYPPGKNSEPNMVLPNLPSRKFIGRSHVQKVAEARVEAINSYCQSLIRLDTKISQNTHVSSFFSPKPGDKSLPRLRLHRPASLHPQKRPAGNTVWEEHCVIAAFDGEGPNQLSAESGEQVQVMNKDSTGWWLVEKKGKVGWMPESYLKKCTATIKDEDVQQYLGLLDPGKKSKDSASNGSGDEGSDSRESSPGIELEAQDYKAIDSYTANGAGQISFEEDDIITVLDKMEDGWWFVAKGKEEGWVPCGYLEPINQEQEQDDISESAASNLDTEKYKTIASYTAEEDDEISFSAGSIAEVMYKSLTGWWMIKCEEKIGLAPATYLKKIDEDQSSLSGSDSGFDSGEQSSGNKSFRQTPRQRTVRKKRSRKGGPRVMKLVEIEEERLTPKTTNEQGRKMSNPAPPKAKPEVVPRKFSHPDSPVTSPKPIPKQKPGSSPKLSPKQMPNSPLLGINTPPRPRQTLIKRAYNSPNTHTEEDLEEGKHQRNLSPSRFSRQRSPSPIRRSDFSPKVTRSLRSYSEEKSGTDPLKQTVTPANPHTQEAAESLIKYVLASNNPDLKSALIAVVSSDPDILKALKD